MVEILKMLEQTLNPAVMNINKANHLQDCLCGLLQVTLIKVGHSIEKPLAANIIHLIVELFKQAEKVTENGLIAFQGLVVGLGDRLEFNETIGSYIKYALESKENDCTKLACGIVSDLSGSLEEGMNQYLDDFVPCLHTVLSDQSLDRRIKLSALMALGDLCTYCNTVFNQKFLQGTLMILALAARTSTQ